jgi:F0F1-type ATP synthase assembly protein I
MIFQMESHHVAGILSAFTLTWLLNDIFHMQNNFLNNPKRQWMVVGLLFAAYCLFVGWLLLSARATIITRVRRLRGNTNASNEEQKSMLRTFQMIATIAGLLAGACSQFLLAAFLWNEKENRPAVGRILLFSMSWSLTTVLLAAAGCFSLRFLVEDEEESSCNLDCLQRQRVLLRMEAYYVSSTLVGICIAWICMDIFLDMTEQILPSLGMLAVSLVAFRAILRRFPEEKCLEEAREQEIVQL